MSRKPNYLAHYAPTLVAQVQQLLLQGKLAGWLQQKYPQAHQVRTDKALYDYVAELKERYLRSADPLHKVAFDNKIHLNNVLGMHSTISRVQGGKLKAKRAIYIASLFKNTPDEFLRMITVHELAHLKQREHDKAFYQLCQHMEPNYGQLEFELRVYLTYLDAGGERLWA